MRVLGIDPGLTRCGVGVVESAPARRVQLVHVDVIRTATDMPLEKRLRFVHDELLKLILEFNPEAIAIERVFAQSNVRTVMGTAQVSGLGLLLASQNSIPVRTYTPSEVKAAVSGNGRADKAQVTSMVTRILNLEVAPKPADAADALAIAICHAWRGHSLEKIEAALALGKK